MLRGSASAKIDDKSRLKVPSLFRAFIEEKYGRELFVTSVSGKCALVYPMPVWNEIEKKLDAMPSTHPARQKYLDHVNFYGQVAELDNQGRVLVHSGLRESAEMNGEVLVIGKLTHLEVWNRERFLPRVSEPLSDEESLQLAQYGI